MTTILSWFDSEQGGVILRCGGYREGICVDCVREVSPGESAFGRTFHTQIIWHAIPMARQGWLVSDRLKNLRAFCTA